MSLYCQTPCLVSESAAECQSPSTGSPLLSTYYECLSLLDVDQEGLQVQIYLE